MPTNSKQVVNVGWNKLTPQQANEAMRILATMRKNRRLTLKEFRSEFERVSVLVNEPKWVEWKRKTGGP